ncbi:MAG: hypothetical protein M1819_003829 [Sarea resinae]|nr:MAG: hypothetical protein M1819_003829 [Sarea resinae]
MNRFRKNRKAKDLAETPMRLSNDTDSPRSPSSIVKPFKKGKKAAPEPEPKPVVDLSTALPSTDDFRTSLLMPKLSARFSMLREQDDPTSKLGKANDDSVLFPDKRQSRLANHGFLGGGLSDIDEVASIRSAVRPPFAYSRTESYGSGEGYGTDDDSSHNGSMMNRSRPGEGNVLFGGRQKVYKIPNKSGSAEGEARDSGKGMGRVLYGDDVSMSNFQKLREEEKRVQREKELEELEREDGLIDPTQERASSPLPSSYNKNRDTSSSTTSGPSNTRTSTAATSIASQGASSVNSPTTSVPISAEAGAPGLDRSLTKSRRLYEQGLDQHLHEQQSSAMSRLQTLQRQRTLNGGSPNISQARSASNLHDRFQRSSPQSGPSVSATTSPPPSAPLIGPGNFDLGFGDPKPARDSPSPSVQSPPLSPPVSEGEDTSALSSAIEPKDRGKATALGAFNKPQNKYDEKQYSQRQLQMQQGRESPSIRRWSPPRAASRTGAAGHGRFRNESNASTRSRSASGDTKRSDQDHGGYQRAAGHLPSGSSDRKDDKSLAETTGTFLAPMSGSESEAEPDEESQRSRIQPTPQAPAPTVKQSRSTPPPLQPESLHMASKAREPQRSVNETADDHEDQAKAASAPRKGSAVSSAKSAEIQADSPTLGPAAGLSGLIRQHLRNDSGQSSIYDAPSPDFSSNFSQDDSNSADKGMAAQFGYASGDPWDYDVDESYPDASDSSRLNGPVRKNSAAPPPLSVRTKKAPDQEPRTSDESSKGRSWEDELRGRHTRDPSTGTQQEREDFANELAQRRKMVQENLRTLAENESRSSSPASEMREPLRAGSALSGRLRPKSSRGSINPTKPENTSKAMRMLGLGGASGASPGSEEHRRKEEERSLRDIVKGPKVPSHPKPFQRGPQDILKDYEQRQRGSRETDRETVLPAGRSSPSIVSSKDSSRERSSSEVSSGRSKSRAGKNSYDVHHTPEEAIGTAVGGYSEISNLRQRSESARPSPDILQQRFNSRNPERSHSDSSPRLRSDSQSRLPGYLDSSALRPIQTNTSLSSAPSPRPSPSTPFSANSTPPLVDSPAISSAAAAATTVPQAFQNGIRIPNHRKKSIHKSDISDPIFLSSTSNVDTVSLPPTARSKSSGSPPPVPPINPRRRRPGATQTLFNAFGRGDKPESSITPGASSSPPKSLHERSFSPTNDGGDRASKFRPKLRKATSDGGEMNARARQQAMMAPSPAMPQFPPGFDRPQEQLSHDGSMF